MIRVRFFMSLIFIISDFDIWNIGDFMVDFGNYSFPVVGWKISGITNITIWSQKLCMEIFYIFEFHYLLIFLIPQCKSVEGSNDVGLTIPNNQVACPFGFSSRIFNKLTNIIVEARIILSEWPVTNSILFAVDYSMIFTYIPLLDDAFDDSFLLRIDQVLLTFAKLFLFILLGDANTVANIFLVLFFNIIITIILKM